MWALIALITIVVGDDITSSFQLKNHETFSSEAICTKYLLSDDFQNKIPLLTGELEKQLRGHPGKLKMTFNCKQEGEPV